MEIKSKKCVQSKMTDGKGPKTAFSPQLKTEQFETIG